MTAHVTTPDAPYRVVISGPGISIDKEIGREVAEALAAVADQGSGGDEAYPATSLHRTPENS